MDSEQRVYHIFDDQTIEEFKNLIIAIGQEMHPQPNWYDVTAAAEYLSCSTRTVRRAVSTGKLRSERLIGEGKRGSLRFHRKWLDAFVLGLNARKLSPVQNRLLNDLYE